MDFYSGVSIALLAPNKKIKNFFWTQGESYDQYKHEYLRGSNKSVAFRSFENIQPKYVYILGKTGRQYIYNIRKFLVEVRYSLEQYIGLKEDKLSSTTVDFIRSEGNLETKRLYWFSKPKMC